MIDSRFISFSLLHALTEVHVSNRQSEKRDRNCYPNNVLHIDLRIKNQLSAMPRVNAIAMLIPTAGDTKLWYPSPGSCVKLADGGFATVRHRLPYTLRIEFHPQW